MKFSVVLPVQDKHGLSPFSPGNFEEDLGTISEYGYHGVELGITDPKSVSVNRVKELLSENGLELSALTTGQAYGVEGISITETDPGKRSAARERLMDHIDFASRFEDVPVIIGSLRGKGEEGPAQRWLVENLSKLAQYAEENEVNLVLEPLNRYESSIVNSVKEGLEVIDEVDSSRLRLLFDTFHANIEEASILESIERGSDRIIYVHLADSNRWAPGFGHLDFQGIRRTLDELDYSGFCSVESLPKPDRKQCLESPFDMFGEVSQV